jgi:hypothetical protein
MEEYDWEAISHLSQQFHPFHRPARLYGTGEAGIEKIFGAAPTAPTPWQSVGKSKKYGLMHPDEREAVTSELRRQPPSLVEVDPRALLASQPSVVQHHLRYYMGRTFDLTGQTSADQGNVGNRFPVILHRPSRNQNVILSGHHRATAALLKGMPLRALRVEGQ